MTLAFQFELSPGTVGSPSAGLSTESRTEAERCLQALRKVRPREVIGNQLLDLGLGLVRGRRHELVDVSRSQMRGQQPDATQVQPPLGHRVE